MKNAISLLVVSVLLNLTATAQTSSPYRLSTTREALLLGGGVSLNGLSYYLESKLKPPDKSRLDPDGINGFDRFAIHCSNHTTAHISDVTLLTSMALPLIPAMTTGSAARNREALLLVVESYVITMGITKLTKVLARRARPYTYRLPQSDLTGDACQSFFSGHTSMAFAGALATGLLTQDLHGEAGVNYAAWTAGLGFALSTGVLRITSGKHFPTDVLVGALAGSLVSYLVIQAHK